jgi:hypothetical protein
MTSPDIDELELYWRDKAKRATHKKNGISPTDMAAGCITCVGCHAWPDVHYWKSKKKADSHWNITCRNCYVPMVSEAIYAETHVEAVAAWNKKNERWT